ncbi:MAG: phosphate-starvation-inducible PsiE family protein, partial [Pseudolabrys sp.]
MPLKEELATARSKWQLLTFYERFEHVVILVLSGLISIVVALAVWNLVLKLVAGVVLSSGFDPTDYSVFQALFGTILTVIIALEFNRSLLVVAERRHGVVQVRTVVLIALLAIVRKLMVIDLSAANANQLFALSAAILVLGCVFWLVREQDRREQPADEP